jgi:hypothetical protein
VCRERWTSHDCSDLKDVSELRSFGVVSPQFWTGETGKRLREYGATVQMIACYLMTSPHSHMCGLYYIPLQYISYETGQPLKAIKGALATLQNEQFAYYDEGTEYVFVKEMSHWQLGPMKNGDKRQSGIEKWYRELPANPFLGVFFDRYQEELQLSTKREFGRSPSQGASVGLLSPQSPSPVPDLSPDLGSAEGETPNEPKHYGEFGHALLTDAQHEKLVAKMGEENLRNYISRFDRWKEENKTVPKVRKRTAYLTIPTWYEKDFAEGKVPTRAPPEKADPEAVERARIKIFGKAAK